MEWESEMTKPKYTIPLMSEIRELDHNGFNVVSTFSGCGGSCLGYRMAGYKVLWANEFIPEAQKTYKANHKDSILDTRDIREIKGEEILERIGLKEGELDIFDGSPPCASFSAAGKKSKMWGEIKKYSDSKQRVDDLFFEYIRILRTLKPKVFVCENVPEIATGHAKGIFKEIMTQLKDSGYHVKASVIDASYLGVPQKRRRMIFIGVRKDLNIMPVFPKPLPYYYTYQDAMAEFDKEDKSEFKEIKSDHAKKLYRESKRYKGSFGNASKALYGETKWFTHTRIQKNKSAPTIVQGGATVYHPEEYRTLSIGEVKRLSSFPDDFILTGTFAKQWERVGRAVPPVMMSKIAKTIEEEILCKIRV